MPFRKSMQHVLARVWWMFLFIGTCAVVYSHAMHQKQAVILGLEKHLSLLKMQKSELAKQREDLVAQIQSQSDPAWIELTLMKGLGVVPEGQQKVYFYDQRGAPSRLQQFEE